MCRSAASTRWRRSNTAAHGRLSRLRSHHRSQFTRCIRRSFLLINSHTFVDLLASAGVDVEARDRLGNTALSLAAFSGADKAVQALVSHKVQLKHSFMIFALAHHTVDLLG
jgi:ankyrin repeat protein